MLYYDGKIETFAVSLFGDTTGNDDMYLAYYGQEGSQSYTAGLRPIITLKLDTVEKMSESETKKVEESSKKLDKTISNEQTSKNKNYKASIIVDDESSKGTKKNTSTKNSSSKDNVTNNYVTNNTRSKIIDYLLILLVSVNLIVSGITLVKVYKK